MKTIASITFVLVSTVACGAADYTDPEVTGKYTNTSTELANDTQSEATKTHEATGIEGYLSNAFDLHVDEERYSDSEDFYTRELDRLTEEAAKAGYEDWQLNFDAAIGLVDLKYGMTVFVASAGNRGFAGQTSVSSTASFSIGVPEAARDQVFRLRAVKRINVTLNPPEELRRTEKSVRWCYNFSAEIADVRVDGEPVVLDNFKTRITKYACSIDNNNGISIPTKKVADNKLKQGE